MTKRTMVLGLLTVLGLAANAVAGHRGQCCDPVPGQLQAMCCQGTLLPYHVALQRAADATRAEAALTATTQERDGLRTELAQLKAELQTAVAERDKAKADAESSAKAAAEQAKVAKAAQADAATSKQAADAATKAKQAADVAAA
ncbi:MAG: hypothetical protein H7062_25800, partial [Candidatus Saccharimonas sp.]|nr:hypothetical protein [Planctomycetaceae bacterium]